MHESQIELSLIDPSPHRRLDLVPLNEQRVEELILAYRRKRPVAPIILREHATVPGRFQLVAGHHRLEAMRRVGITERWCQLVHGDDDKILTIADEECKAQHSNPYGRDHAFEAVISHYRWLMIRLLSEQPPQNAEAGYSHEDSGFGVIKKEGIGSPQLIEDLKRRHGGTLAPSGFSEKQIEAALSLFKSSALYVPTIEWARDDLAVRFGLNSEAVKAANEMVEAAGAKAVTIDSKVVRLFRKPTQAAEFCNVVAEEGIPITEHHELAKLVVNAPVQVALPDGEVFARDVTHKDLSRVGAITKRTRAFIDERRKNDPNAKAQAAADARRAEIRAKDNLRIVRARMKRTAADMSLFVDNVRAICDLTGLCAKLAGPAELADDVREFRKNWEIFLQDVKALKAAINNMEKPHD